MTVANISQRTIRVDVDFYDETERSKLLHYPTSAALARLVSSPIEIPTAEFLTYYLFHKKRLGHPAYRDYRSIGARIDTALGMLDGCVDFDGRSISRAEGDGAQITEVSEHVGEAVGLSVANRIHGLTLADWDLIPTQPGRHGRRTFDFQVASDGERFVELETKGSSSDDNRLKSDAVKAQKRRIDEKKDGLGRLTPSDEGRSAGPLRYGSITVLDRRPNGTARCWLTDPDAAMTAEDPRRWKLLARMRFLRDWIAFVSVRSQLAAALATRVADLEALADTRPLERLPLLRGNGKAFDFRSNEETAPSLFANKSFVIGGNAGGLVVRMSGGALFFLGIQHDMVALAARPEPEALLGYRAEWNSAERVVRCKVNKTTFVSWDLGGALAGEPDGMGSNVEFELSGQIHSDESGLVFGVLPLTDGTR